MSEVGQYQVLFSGPLAGESRVFSMATSSKEQRTEGVQSLLQSFNSCVLDKETAGFVLALLKRISRTPGLDLTRGREEIWAAAIVSVIARLNFLFDPERERPLTPGLICDFFQSNQRTVLNKANQIEKACELEIGDPGLCRPEIVDSLRLVELPGGFILPANGSGLEIVYEFLEGEEAEELERQIAEEHRRKEREAEEKRARRTDVNRRIAHEKKRQLREKIEEFQPGLFDS